MCAAFVCTSKETNAVAKQVYERVGSCASTYRIYECDFVLPSPMPMNSSPDAQSPLAEGGMIMRRTGLLLATMMLMLNACAFSRGTLGDEIKTDTINAIKKSHDQNGMSWRSSALQTASSN